MLCPNFQLLSLKTLFAPLINCSLYSHKKRKEIFKWKENFPFLGFLLRRYDFKKKVIFLSLEGV
jgi:hypothetical protein